MSIKFGLHRCGTKNRVEKKTGNMYSLTSRMIRITRLIPLPFFHLTIEENKNPWCLPENTEEEKRIAFSKVTKSKVKLKKKKAEEPMTCYTML